MVTSVRSNDLHVCNDKCGGIEEYMRDVVKEVEYSPSFKTIFGDDGLLDQICRRVAVLTVPFQSVYSFSFADCHLNCAASVFSKACNSQEAGQLLLDLVASIGDGIGDKLVEYELTGSRNKTAHHKATRYFAGLAAPKCREILGASGESVKSIASKASVELLNTFTETFCLQSLLSGVIALAILLIIALIVIGVLVYKMRAHRGNLT